MGRDKIISYASVTALVLALVQITAVKGDPEVPCYYIFGDSLADPGNNNLLLTIARANYKPYGVDFPGAVPTGRFNNGPTTPDYIGKLLGFSDFIPPFITAEGRDILRGVNYGSGVSGIRDETGIQFGLVLSMNKQLRNHEVTFSRVANFLDSSEAAQNYLRKCIYYVGMGTEDYFSNYFAPLPFAPISLTPLFFTIEQFTQALIDQYRGQLKRLYDLGARKVVLAGIGPIGCRPASILLFGAINGSPCAERLNNAAQLFNNKLIGLVDEFNSNFNDTRFIYTNTFGILGAPSFPAFAVKYKACCVVSLLTKLCVPLSTPCQNRSEYVYYDSFHPSAAANNLTAVRSYTASSPNDTYPIDIQRLARLQL